jgi:hypothetical protein
MEELDFKSGVAQEKGVRKRKNHKELMNKNMWRLFQQ